MDDRIYDFEIAEYKGVPQGQYIAIFKEVKRTNHAQYGEGVMFVFEICAGPYSKQTVTRVGKPQPTTENITGKIISGITGMNLQGGVRTNLRPFVGKMYNLLMENTNNNKTRIAQVWEHSRQTEPLSNNPNANFDPYDFPYNNQDQVNKIPF
jgi:hypothetical protein